MSLAEPPDLFPPEPEEDATVREGTEAATATLLESPPSVPVIEESGPDVPLSRLVLFQLSMPPQSAVSTLIPSLQLRDPLPEISAPPSLPEDSVEPDVPLGRLVIFEKSESFPSGMPDALGDFAAPGRGAPVDFPAEEAGPAFRKAIVREWAESLAMVVAFILVFTGYVAQATQVPTESMKPTILVGDHFFIEKLAFPGNYPAAVRPFLPQRAVRRGDIVVFRSPVDGKIPFVKRVIGTPGDRVEIRQKDVFVNDVKLDEPYKIHIDQTIYREDGWTPEDLRKRDNYGPVVIPPDNFFVMGDNRDNSNDSRYWGFVGRDAIMGMPLFVYWSYRAEPYGGPTLSAAERLNDYVSTGMHFFSRTRWFRFGTLVQ